MTGDRVYIYSISLNEVIEGVIEGYADENGRRYKVLQFIEVEGMDLRHIVSYVYVFETYDEACKCKEEYAIRSSIDVTAGNIVYLLDKMGAPILDWYGNPCQYQVVAVYRDTGKVGLVTSYGEYIGLHDENKILYVDVGPIFKSEDYEEGTVVVWIEEEDIYEGVIDTLHNSTVTVREVKKLMPVDYKIRIPYWKIPDGRKSNVESTSKILHTIIGDDLD